MDSFNTTILHFIQKTDTISCWIYFFKFNSDNKRYFLNTKLQIQVENMRSNYFQAFGINCYWTFV